MCLFVAGFPVRPVHGSPASPDQGEVARFGTPTNADCDADCKPAAVKHATMYYKVWEERKTLKRNMFNDNEEDDTDVSRGQLSPRGAHLNP